MKKLQLRLSCAVLIVALLFFSHPVLWAQNLLVTIQKVVITDTTGTPITTGSDATTNTTTQPTGPQTFGNGSAAVPSAVGADGRSVAFWTDKSGRQQVNGDASMTALKVDPSAVTSPVSLASVPTHAVTVASGGIASGAIASGAVASGAYASDSASFGVGATGAAPPAKGVFATGLASGATGGFLTGITVCDLSKPVNISTATTTLMVTGVSGRQVRVCSFHLITAAANNVAWLEGTGATCGTGTAGMAGGTTAASGYNFAANGGLAIGTGLGEVLTTATTGDSVCLITSAATQLSGFIKYTIF